MNKKKFAVLALLLIAVMVLSLGLLVACNNNGDGNDNTKNDPIKPTEGLLISNGDFKVVGTSTTAYPRTITDWTGAKMYTSGSYADDVIAGAIHMSAAAYNENKSKWNDSKNDELYNLLTKDGRYGESDKIKNALMIYMPEKGTDLGVNDADYGPTAYGYTSANFTLARGSYYKLSVDVLTYNISGEKNDNGELTGNPGARIYLSSNTYAEFDGIDTKGEWKTFEIFIEAAPSSTTTLSVMLGLGKYTTTYSKGLTTGYAFFDNVELVKIDENPEAAYKEAVQKEIANNDFIRTATLKVPNGRFDFGSNTLSNSSVPNSWTLITGNSGKSDPAPTSLGFNAIIDAGKFNDKVTAENDNRLNYQTYSSTYYMRNSANVIDTYVPANSLSAIGNNLTNFLTPRAGSNIYMLSQQLMTAQGVRTSRNITIEKNKIYALSIDLYTHDVHGAGVSLVLSGNDGKDIVIKGISQSKYDGVLIGNQEINPDDNSYTVNTVNGASTNGWVTYTFYIIGNQFRDYNYKMSVWLGTEGTGSNTKVDYTRYTNSSGTSTSQSTTYKANGTFSSGWVFMDELRIEEGVTIPYGDSSVAQADKNQTLDCSVAGMNDKTALVVDLSSENLFSTNAGADNGNDLSIGNTQHAPSIEGNNVTMHGIPNGWKSNFDKSDKDNPIIANGIITEGLVQIDTEDNFKNSGGKGTYPKMPYNIENKTAYMMNASEDGYFEIESAPFTVGANSFHRVSLWVKTCDIKSTSGIYVYLLKDEEDGKDPSSLSTFTKINTDEYDEYTNDWCELTFLIRGSNEDSTTMRLKFTLGTGNRWASETLTTGSVYVANMNMTAITAATFSGTSTGTYVKSVDLSSSTSYTFTNGGFDDYDLDDEDYDSTKLLQEQTIAATPERWSFSDDKLKDEENSKLVAGIIGLNDEHRENFEGLYFNGSNQTNALFPNIDFNNFYGDESNNDFYLSKENMESIGGPNMLAIGSQDATKYAAGFASDSFTLSANTNYVLSVYVKTVGKTNASIFLTGEASTLVETNSFKIENTNDSDWVKYSFYIKVSTTSVSLKLNLWLGYNAEYMEVEGETKEDKAENAKSSGAVFFDNVTLNSIDDEKFDSIQADNKKTAKLSFTTDSFDSISSTIESRGSLTSPTGWSGSADDEQSASNTKGGVIYADGEYLTTDSEGYVTILGNEIKLEDMTITDEEFQEAKASGKYDDMSDDEITAALKEIKLAEQKAADLMPLNELVRKTGYRMLIINNTKESAYKYTSSNMTLTANSVYKISVWVRTYNIEGNDRAGAFVELYLGSANESSKPFIFKSVRTDKDGSNEWKKLEFFVSTRESNVTSVTLRLGLGKYYTDEEEIALAKGYAMFDDVTVETVTEADYEKAVEDAKTNDAILARRVADENTGSSDKPTDPITPNNKFNLDYLWWMIPTIILGALIIVVVIVYVVRKVRKPKRNTSNAIPDAPIFNANIDEKHDRYDDNKE